jgi:hypothetical protein
VVAAGGLAPSAAARILALALLGLGIAGLFAVPH